MKSTITKLEEERDQFYRHNKTLADLVDELKKRIFSQLFVHIVMTLLRCTYNDRYVYKFVQKISLCISSIISLMFEVSNLSVNSSFYQRILGFSFKQK